MNYRSPSPPPGGKGSGSLRPKGQFSLSIADEPDYCPGDRGLDQRWGQFLTTKPVVPRKQTRYEMGFPPEKHTDS